MNAFKAYKACVPIAWSPNIYITLVRGIPGPGGSIGALWKHFACANAIELSCDGTHLQLGECSNRLVVIETEEMYKARKQKEEAHRALRSPFIISHKPPLVTDAL